MLLEKKKALKLKKKHIQSLLTFILPTCFIYIMAVAI